MRLKELFYLLGGRKPEPKAFGWTLETHDLPREGRVEFARWLNPGAYRITAPEVQATVDQLRRFLGPGDVALDIGAHSGDTALPMALAVGPTGAVLAFEPNPYVFPVLRQNASLNPDRTRIVPLPYAAMRTDGAYEFQYGDESFNNGGFHEGVSRWRHGSAFKLTVEGRNIEELLAREYPALISRVRFIKVDTEGFDLAVLETIEGLIQARRPYVQVEVFNLRKSSAEYRRGLLAFFDRHRYVAHRVRGAGDLLGEVVTADNLMSWNHYDIFCVPDAI